MADSSDPDSENWAPATPATQDDLASAILYDKSSIAAGGPQKPRPRSAPTSPARREERASSLTPPAQRPPRTAPQSAPRRLTAPRNPDRGRPHAAPVTPNHRAVRPARTTGARRLRSSVERVQQLARAPQLAMIAAQDLPEKLKTTRVAAVRHARQERSITNGQYYLLLVAALLLTGTASARAAYLMFEWGVRGMAWSRALWSMQHEEFRVWTAVTCADPWQAETVLCQAAGGSWIARELIRAKVATTGEDHCSKDSKGDGCRYEPCPERGLSMVLLNLADSWRSPLNNPFDKLYLVLRPVRKKARALLHSIAAGKVPLSELERVIHTFPWGENIEGNDWFSPRAGLLRAGTDRAKTWLLTKVVYPALREWGVYIGGAVIPPAHGCRTSSAPQPADDAVSLPELLSTGLGDAVASAYNGALDFVAYLEKVTIQEAADEMAVLPPPDRDTAGGTGGQEAAVGAAGVAGRVQLGGKRARGAATGGKDAAPREGKSWVRRGARGVTTVVQQPVDSTARGGWPSWRHSRDDRPRTIAPPPPPPRGLALLKPSRPHPTPPPPTPDRHAVVWIPPAAAAAAASVAGALHAVARATARSASGALLVSLAALSRSRGAGGAVVSVAGKGMARAAAAAGRALAGSAAAAGGAVADGAAAMGAAVAAAFAWAMAGMLGGLGPVCSSATAAFRSLSAQLAAAAAAATTAGKALVRSTVQRSGRIPLARVIRFRNEGKNSAAMSAARWSFL